MTCICVAYASMACRLRSSSTGARTKTTGARPRRRGAASERQAGGQPARAGPALAAVHDPVTHRRQQLQALRHRDGEQAGGAMIGVAVERRGREDQGGVDPLEHRGEIRLQAGAGVRMPGVQRLRIGHGGGAAEGRGIGLGAVRGEQLEHPAVGIAKKQLAGGRYAEQRSGRARLAHAARRQLARRASAHERAVLDQQQVELGGIAARHPHDAHVPAGRGHALHHPRAAQRLVVGMGRDHQQRGCGVEWRQAGQRGGRGRERAPGTCQQHAEQHRRTAETRVTHRRAVSHAACAFG